MTKALHARGGRVAVYDYAGHDNPFHDPLNNLGSLYFHSDLHYPAIVDERAGALTLPARGANQQGWSTYTLFAHGRPGNPLVLGQIENIHSSPVALAGSVPIQMNAIGFGRWLTLGANGAHVLLNEQYLTQLATNGLSARAIAWRVYVFDTLL